MKDIPEIPKQIVDAINDGSFTVFVGAGISRIAGLPSWDDLAESLIDECESMGFITYYDKVMILTKIKDCKQLITIAYTILCENKQEDIFLMRNQPLHNIERIYNEKILGFYDVGAFAKYPDSGGRENWGELSYSAVIVIWLRSSIDIMNSSDAMNLAKKYISSEVPLFRKMATYCISTHFDVCNSLIFESKENPFDDSEIYSDLFDMLVVNSSRMKKSHIEQVATWIKNANFGTDKLQVRDFRRALIYRQLAKSNRKYNAQWDDFSSTVEYEYGEHEAYNVSKDMYLTYTEYAETDPIIVQSMERMMPSEILDYLNNIKFNWKIDESLVGRSMISFFVDNQTTLFENIDLFINLREELLPYIIQSMERMEISKKTE